MCRSVYPVLAVASAGVTKSAASGIDLRNPRIGEVYRAAFAAYGLVPPTQGACAIGRVPRPRDRQDRAFPQQTSATSGHLIAV